MNSNEFLLDSGFWGFLYKILTPVEWLQTWIMKIVHDFFVMLGVSPIGVSWVLAIIILVLVVQACIFPLFYKQMKSMRKMQALAPKMQRIQNKYKGKTDQASREAMSRETMKLYQDNDVNPAGSCLPMLIQGPVFMSMFYTLSAIPYIANGKRDALGAFDVATAKQFTQTDVFGIVSVTDNFTSAAASGKAVIGIFVFLMCFCLWFMQYFSMKRNMAAASMNKQHEAQHGSCFDEQADRDHAEGYAVALPGDVHLLRCRHAVRRAGLLADQQRVQPLPHIVAGVRIPDPWLSGCGGQGEARSS